MKIVVATAHGMCFGVSDALAAADRIEDPSEVTIYGELVHNEIVRERLLARGFSQMGERDREIPSTPAVLITAHGVSGAERGRLAAAQLRVVDTTCPLVRHAHSMALQLDAEDRLVVVVGKGDHVEVRGIVGDLRRFVVIESAEKVGNLGAERIGVMSQTTTPDARFAEVVAAIRRENPNCDIKVVSTICRPTRERQQSVAALLEEVQLLVVVGGERSRNSRELVETALRAGVAAHLVPSAAALDARWFEGVEIVGVTAGTSTLPETFEEVLAALRQLSPAAC